MRQNLGPHAMELLIDRRCIAVVETMPFPFEVEAQSNRETHFLRPGRERCRRRPPNFAPNWAP